MRLFTAICLDHALQQQLAEIIEKLKAQGVRGNFTRPENLHLTLCFIGETGRLDAAARSVRSLEGNAAFSLETTRLGWFHRSGGSICYLACKESKPLSELQKKLDTALRREDFRMEARSFKAHLTLGRAVSLPEDFDERAFSASLPRLIIPVEKVSLMKSDRRNGCLCYTEMMSRTLWKPPMIPHSTEGEPL